MVIAAVAATVGSAACACVATISVAARNEAKARLLLEALRSGYMSGSDVKELMRRQEPSRLAQVSTQGMTGMAALVAGRRRRPDLRDEWRSHLAEETGLGLPGWRRIRAALGFVIAAVRYRLRDAADLAWMLADRVLRSRRLSNLFVLIPTTIMAVFIFVHEGTLGVMKAMESISATGLVLCTLVRGGRKWRDVKPPDPSPRSKD